MGFMIQHTEPWGAEYYTGKFYTHDGERFGVFAMDFKQAKLYKSKALAERVVNTTYRSLSNSRYEHKIIEAFP